MHLSVTSQTDTAGSDENLSSDTYGQIWQQTLADSYDSLEPQDHEQVKVIRSESEFWDAITALQESLPNDKPISLSTPSLRLRINQIAKGSRFLTQLLEEPLSTSLLWGLLYLAIKLATQGLEASDFQSINLSPNDLVLRSSAILDLIALKLELFEPYSLTTITRYRIQRTALDIHVWILQFLVACVRFLRGYETCVTLESKAADLIENMDQASKHLQRLTWGASLQSAGDAAGGVHRLLSHSSGDPVVYTQLPYENLPRRRNPHFFGREAILSDIERNFARDLRARTLHTVALYGLGGMGKTQIALEFAHRAISNYDAILWIHSETPLAISQDFTAVALGLKLPGAAPQDDKTNHLLVLDWLRKTSSRWLIIFDNVADTALVEEYWPTSGFGSILITARAPTVGFQLANTRIEIPAFSKTEGAELVLRLLDRSDVGENEEKAAKELASKLNGHALAIDQMTALIHYRGWSIANFNISYDKHTKAIHRTHRSSRPKDYDFFLDTVWDMSFQSLDISGSKLLGMLCLMSPDSIPRQVLLQSDGFEFPNSLEFCTDDFLLSEVEEQLLRLALVKKAPGIDELSLHRLVQTEFLYKLNSTERQSAFDHGAELLHGSFPKQINGRMMHADWHHCQLYVQHVVCMATHYDNKSTDFAYAPSDAFCQLLSNCAWFMSENDSPQLSYLLDVAFKALDACNAAETHPIIYAHMCNTKGVMHLDNGQFDLAHDYLERCRSIRERILAPNHEELANIYNNIGNVAYSRCEYEAAYDWQLKAESIRLSLHNETAAAMSNLNTGRALWRLSRGDETVTRLDTAIEQLEQTGNWYMLAHVHLFYGTVFREKKDYENAKMHYSVAKDLMIDKGRSYNHYTTSAILYKQGCLALDQGQKLDAVELLRESLLISELRGSAIGEQARILRKLAEALEDNDVHESDETLNRAKLLRRQIEGNGYNSDDQSEAAYDKLVCGNSR